MKTANDPRHLHRIKAFKQIFTHAFLGEHTPDNDLALGTLAILEEIDPVVTKSAPEWPLSQINRVDLAVLRLAIYELLKRPQIPSKVIIDEAVEIGKRYGGSSSGSFVNGALASALKITRSHESQSSQA